MSSFGSEDNFLLVIGLTGLIGSGKSTVANLFANYGAAIIDSDIIARELTVKNSAALAQLAAEFGSAIIDAAGELERSVLRRLVFNDTAARLKLEHILHPLIFKQVVSQLAAIRKAPYTILVVPLLFKCPEYLTLIKRNIFVDCAYELIVSRLACRSSLSQLEVDAILAGQVGRMEQLALADDIIYNDSTLADLQLQVKKLQQKYLLAR